MEAQALKAGGKPVPNQAREVWIQGDSALNRAQHQLHGIAVSMLGIVVGIALLLAETRVWNPRRSVAHCVTHPFRALTGLQSHGDTTHAPHTA